MTSEEERARLERLFARSPELFGGVRGADLVWVNEAWTRQLGWSAAELLARPLSAFLHPDDVDATHAAIEYARSTRSQPRTFANRVRKQDGSHAWFEWSTLELDEGALCIVGRDVTRRRQAEARVAENEALLHALIDCTPDLIFFKDSSGTYRSCNAAFARFVGRPRGEIEGKTVADLFPDELARVFREQDQATLGGETQRVQDWVMSHDGREVLLDTLIVPYVDPAGEIHGEIGIARDVTAAHEAREALERSRDALEALNEELRRLATTDELTGAYNRRRFMTRADEELARFRRYGRPLSVLMLDLDRFKELNDTHRHRTGDEALRRFVLACRETLRDIDVLGRLGGEEFAVLLPETTLDDAMAVAERIRQRVTEVEVPTPSGASVGITVSIGGSDVGSGDPSIEAALARADEALFAAKHGGRNRTERRSAPRPAEPGP